MAGGSSVAFVTIVTAQIAAMARPLCEDKKVKSMRHAGKTVEQFITALNNEDMTTAGTLLSPGFKFVGVLGTREGADIYMEDMERMKIKYTIHKIFEDGEDVCVLCDYIMAGVTVFGCSWYQLENGKISALRAVFDPRPLL